VKPERQPLALNAPKDRALSSRPAAARARGWLSWVALLALLTPNASNAEERRDVLVPMSRRAGGPQLDTQVITPGGDGPFPVVILNHGSPRTPDDRVHRPAYKAATRWFIDRGFAVLIPSRRGYGRSKGAFAEGFGSCDRPDYVKAARATAADIRAVVAWARAQSWVQRDAIIPIGQSAGGFGVIALAAESVPGVAGVINFAGGRGSPADGRNCSAKALRDAARIFGRTAKAPSLWVYAQNDRFFWPKLARGLYRAYRSESQSRSLYVQLPPFGRNGHGVFSAADGPEVWGPVVSDFLRSLGFAVAAGPESLERRQREPALAAPPEGFLP
jgi:dienelactone hydrolase